jgi:hypothetical protein
VAWRLFGSWPRVFGTLSVGLNLLLILLVFALLFVPRASVFRLDANTDLLTFRSSGQLIWGEAQLRGLEGNAPVCGAEKDKSAPGSVVVPEGASIEARRYDDAVLLTATAPEAGPPLQVRCSGGAEESHPFVELSFEPRRLPLTTSAGALDRRTFAAGVNTVLESRQPAGAVRISGRGLRVGGSADGNSPIAEAPLLRSGVLVSESTSWPLPSSSVVAERALHVGEIISFDEPLGAPGPRGAPVRPRQEAEFDGLLLLSGETLRAVVRTEVPAGYVTSPGALGGRPAIVAPTVLQRLQAQAEWGLFVVIGALALNVLGVLRGGAGAQETFFKWAEQRRGRIAASAFLALAFGLPLQPDSAVAQTVDDHPVVRIFAENGEGQGFLVLNPRGTPRCLVVTVGHVVKRGERVKLVGERRSPNGPPVRIDASARYLDALGANLIVLEPDLGADFGGCAPLAPVERVSDYVRADVLGLLTFAEPSGRRRLARVLLDGSAYDEVLSVTGVSPAEQISPGLSGSPYSIGGRILGLANSVADGTAGLLRLERGTIDPRYLAAPTPTASPTIVKTPTPPPREGVLWPPFDVSRLPPDHRRAVEAARAMKSQALVVQTVAADNAKTADEAVVRASAGLPGYGLGSLKDADRVYRGQLQADGMPAGFGKLSMIGGKNVGDTYRGFFRAEKGSSSMVGAGIADWGDPSNHGDQTRYEANMIGGGNGPGVMTLRDGSTIWTSWKDGVNTSAGVYRRGSDGAILEGGFVDGRWAGLGVLWSKEGQPACICEWKDGKVIRDQTRAAPKDPSPQRK